MLLLVGLQYGKCLPLCLMCIASALTTLRSCRWWQLWPQRPAMASDLEELALLEGDLTLEEVINFRTRTALRCSKVMRNRPYRTLAVPVLGALAVNPNRGLPTNFASVLLGHKVCHLCRHTYQAHPTALLLLQGSSQWSLACLLCRKVFVATMLRCAGAAAP